MRSHRGAGRGRRSALAGWWPATQVVVAPVPVDRHRNTSMALTLVALTLLFLALAMFGPAQSGNADQATAGSATGVVRPAVEVLDAPGDGAVCGSQDTTCWAPVTMTGAQ